MSDQNPSTDATINTYEQDRRAKLQALRDLGVEPYGRRTVNVTPLRAARALFKTDTAPDAGPVVTVAGRVMLKRDMGKLTFATLRDETGDLQIGLDKKRLSEKDWQVNTLIDLGDQIVVTGKVGVTKKGETTVWVGTDPVADGAISMAAKALLPPPEKWQGLTDVEARYRQRYVDLWSNPDVMRVLKLRTRIVDEIRSFLKHRGYTEVETPMMQPLHGGAAARPFETHHKALDMKLFLRIAPELYLKRLLVGGFGKVFEINRNFRNEGISPRHNPEFTMLEAYEAFGSWETMAELVEEMICTVALNVFGTLQIGHGGPQGTPAATGHETTADPVKHGAFPSTPPAVPNEPTAVRRTINLTRPWRRASMASLVEGVTGWTFDQKSLAGHPHALSTALMKYDIDGSNALSRRSAGLQLMEEEERAAARLTQFEKHLLALSPAEQLVELYEKLVEPTLLDPCFVTHVPSVIIPLARKNRDDPFFADVYELAINGQEISPGYSELNDPDVQADNFRHQVGDKDEQQKVDEDFLTALKYGMPPAGGMGLGIDRLVMMLTGSESIRDVILFPLMRPQE